MKRISVLPLLAAAAAALFAGCEWTHSSGESSWSGSYDDMNFAGTYRISSLAQTGESGGSSAATWTTTSEGGGTFAKGKKTASGKTAHNNVVPGSVKIAAGGYVWTDDGSGNLVFNGGSSGSTTPTTAEYAGTKTLGSTVATQKNYSGTLAKDLVPGSVSITVGSYATFQDNGSGSLNGGTRGSGTVNYNNGVVEIVFTSNPSPGQAITASYKYTTTTSDSTEGVSGSGTVAYSSGAWTLVLSTGMASASSVSVTYSYYASTSGVDASTFDPSKVTAITVSQTGQNLTLALNNGVTMAGRFTSVHKTGSTSSSGVDAYNAQFQVSSGSNSKLVGTLSYETASGNRVLNGTWTWNSKTFDVNAVGPSW